MLTCLYPSGDARTGFGLRHFFGKYGLSVKSDPSGHSGVTLKCGGDPDSGFTIRAAQDHPGDGAPGIPGYLRVSEGKIPLFATPSDSGDDGRILGWWEGGNGDRFPCITGTGAGISIGFDPFGEIGALLSGRLEPVWKGPDEGLKRGMASLPVADLLEDLLFRLILAGYGKLRVPLVSLPFWPQGRAFAVCLTHDVDEVKKTYQWITTPLKLAARGDVRGLYFQGLSLLDRLSGKEPYWAFDDLMSLEDGLGARSSLFFLHETARVRPLESSSWRHLGRRYRWDDPKLSSLIRRLSASGWDVGLHGSFNSYDDLPTLEGEKKSLEKVLGEPVYTTRQHNLNLRIPETWLHHEGLGLLCDTTLGFNDRIGFRWGTCFPFSPFLPAEGRALNLLELPLVIEDIALLRNPRWQEEWVKIAGTVRGCGGVLTLLWHHAVFNPHEYPGWGDAYRQILSRAGKENAWIASARDIARWWVARNGARTECHLEGDRLGIRMIRGALQPVRIHVPEGMELKEVLGGSPVARSPGTIDVQPAGGDRAMEMTIVFSGGYHGS